VKRCQYPDFRRVPINLPEIGCKGTAGRLTDKKMRKKVKKKRTTFVISVFTDLKPGSVSTFLGQKSNCGLKIS
jgi:hypothetical protein